MIGKILTPFRLAFDNIRTNLLHTILSILGIVIGVGALVAILSMIDGMEKFANEQISANTPFNSILIQTNTHKRVNGIRLKKDTISYLDYENYSQMLSDLSKPAKGVLKNREAIETRTPGSNSTIPAIIWSTTWPSKPDMSMLEGEVFDMEPDSSLRMIVNRNFSEELQKIDSVQPVLGREITVRARTFEVMGIVEDQSKQPEAYIPITLKSEEEYEEAPPGCIIEVEEITDVPKLEEEINQWLDARYPEESFQVVTNSFRVKQLNQGMLLFKIIMGLITGLSVLVGGIGVMNVLLISVTERTTEIGIRKAAGAKRRDIVFLFLAESVTISGFGSILGVILGIVVTLIAVPVIRHFTELPFSAHYTLNTMMVIAVLAVLVGVIFGTYPAMRASRLDPVEAIRRE